MVDSTITRKLARAFPRSFINTNLEFIAHKKANEYFRLEDCNLEFEVKCKVLEWLSRGAYKSCPFDSDFENEKLHAFMLNGINDFLGTYFTEDDIEIVYTHLGNRCNHELTVEFINSGYDMAVFERSKDDDR